MPASDGALAQVADLRHGEGELSPPRPVHGVPEVDQPIPLAMREWLEEYAADHTENRGVCADAERQRQHDYRGEHGAMSQRPGRVGDVGGDALEPRDAALRP